MNAAAISSTIVSRTDTVMSHKVWMALSVGRVAAAARVETRESRPTEPAMTTVEVEHFGAPVSVNRARELELTRRRAVDELETRTLWCATARPSGYAAARRLHERLRHAGLGARLLALDAHDPLGELLRAIEADDVVVLHDPPTAMVAAAIRDLGAHALCHATEPVAGCTYAVDAYLVTWREPAVDHIAAVMPAANRVAEKDIDAERRGAEAVRDAAWSCVLADVALEDRGEHVGGRLHARPAVAAR
jgi:hypothetical protein